MKRLVADLHKCNGCNGLRDCEAACAQALFKSDDAAFSSIHWTSAEGGSALSFCDQCGDCIAICPAGALYRSKAGTVMVRKQDCVACYMCVGFCRTRAMIRAAGKLEPFKCISCGHCVEACPAGALWLEERDHAELPA